MKRAKNLGRSLLSMATILAVGFTTRASFADHYFVPSGSMEPTVQTGDHIFVNKAAYGIRVPLTDTWMMSFGPPRRGEVVILEADKPEVLLKRVVAVGGDVVEVRGGHVLLDGEPTSEPMVRFEWDGDAGPDFGPVRVPAGKLLVLGDNRGNSRDGRTFGWIDQSRVLGRAVAVISRGGTPTFRSL